VEDVKQLQQAVNELHVNEKLVINRVNEELTHLNTLYSTLTFNTQAVRNLVDKTDFNCSLIELRRSYTSYYYYYYYSQALIVKDGPLASLFGVS
jgi:hypothetical protein